MHKAEFAKVWNAFLNEGEPYMPLVRVDPNGKGTICMEVAGDFPAQELALSFGEMMYQLRAALDSLVYEVAVIDSGQDPPPDAQKLEFPIRDSAASFERAARKIAPLSEFHQAMVESVQPYDIEERPKGHQVSAESLKELNDLARKDRHRGLRIVTAWVANKNPEVSLPPGCELEWIEVTPDGLLDRDGVIASFKISNWEVGLEMEGNPNCSIDVTVEDAAPPVSDEDTLDSRARMMLAVITLIIEGFEETLD